MCESNLRVRQYTSNDFEAWDKTVEQSRNGTFIHTRKFLSHQGERFQDASLVIENVKGSIVGVFPAAIDPQKKDRVVSHPGITYGGIVDNGFLKGERMLEALQTITTKYREQGFSTLRYKAVPYIYHRMPASDDLYALFRLGAMCYRRDLSSTIDIANRPKLCQGRRYSFKKAEKSGVLVQSGHKYLEYFWPILEENLAEKYSAKPVHSLAEIQLLSAMFPNNIKCSVGMLNDQVVAGTVIFKTEQVIHTQYIAANQKGRDVSAIDLIIEFWISATKMEGIRYFNFGTSTEKEGTYLNQNLYEFKSKFGAGSVTHDFLELSLN